MSNVLENTLSIEGCKGLYIKNTVGLKAEKLTQKDYKAFNSEKELHFVMRVTSPKEVRRNLTPVKKVGIEVRTAIALAEEEKKRIVSDLKNGIDPKASTVNDELITIERLWNEYLTHNLNKKTMSEGYAKNCTYYFNKHMKPFFMPYKTQKKEVIFKIRVINEDTKKYEFKEIKEIQKIPMRDAITRQLILDEKAIIDIRHITFDMLNERMTALNNGCYERNRRDSATNERYVEYIPYKPATAHQFIKAFQPMFEYARKTKRYISENPMIDVEAPTYENTRDFKISDKKEKELYTALMTYPELKFRAIFMFLLNGRRKNEVLKLKWDDINFDTMEYHVRYYNSKNRRGYTYVLPEHIANTLVCIGGVREGYVFKSDRTGDKIDNFDKRWHAILEKLGLSNITRHDMRHWVGNMSVNSGKTTSEIASALGHADERTARRYAKTTSKTAAKVTDAFHAHYSE